MSKPEMSTQSQPNPHAMAQACAPNVNERRQNLVRILSVHRSLADVERCLHELKRLRFTVSSDVVLTPEQLAARVRVDCYDAIVSEYPSSNWDEEHVLDLVRRVGSNIPVVLLVHGMKREASAEFILKGAADCLEMENLGHLPVAVQRALDEKVLRDQRERPRGKRVATFGGAVSRVGGKSQLRNLPLWS